MTLQEIADLKVGKIYTNHEIMSAFKVANSGGIRYSKTTNSIVIFSFTQVRSVKDMPYQDTWQGTTIHYTGQGKSGDQSLTRNNKKLAESNKAGIPVYLFEAFEKGENIYQGRVSLVNKPYQVTELDSNNTHRHVYKFPLKLLGEGALVSRHHLIDYEKNQKDSLNKVSLEDIEKAAKETSRVNNQLAKEGHIKNNGSRKVVYESYTRNPAITIYVKQIANGVCALCNEPAPFLDKKGQPFLHVHHIDYLADGGLDVIENCVALCPNCHAKIHSLNDPRDKEKLIQKVKNRSL